MTEPVRHDVCEGVTLYLGDCLEVLPSLPDASFDVVLTDPPYPEIGRSYGRLTERQWADMMVPVVRQVRRLLTPKGSAVFVLQPNSRQVGSMRPWLWEFMAWVCREWNMVQDAWWWNYTAIPEAHAIQGCLLRPSVKACVWCGPPDCWRDQDRVLWRPSEYTARQALRAADRWREVGPSGHGMNRTACAEASLARDGSTPYNLLPVSNARGHESGGGQRHPAATPEALCEWWLRYLCPPRGRVLDPFAGSATVGLAALRLGHEFVGIEKDAGYVETARRRLCEPVGPLFLTPQASPAPAPSLFDCAPEEP